jgi:hypothetical protein
MRRSAGGYQESGIGNQGSRAVGCRELGLGSRELEIGNQARPAETPPASDPLDA